MDNLQGPRSLAEWLACAPLSVEQAILSEIPEDEAELLLWSWHYWARPKQLAPPGDWATWMVRAGRGFGKTRTGAGWTHDRALEQPGRWIALVGRTPADVRDYMLEGPSGLLRNTPPWERPSYEPSKRRVTWPNESWATIYSADEPDQLRGFSGDTAWLDEMGKWARAKECWDNLQFGMRERSEDRPRRIITTTPRPLPILRDIEKMPGTVVTVGTSYENRTNLDESWYAETIKPYAGTRMGRQEIDAEYLDDVPGALFTRAMIEKNRVPADRLPDMTRIVVGVDPSGAGGDADEPNNAIGIVGCGRGTDGKAYVFEDWTILGSPATWGRRVIDLYSFLEADRVVAEINFGGAMVESTIRASDPKVSYKGVHASRGKIVRAEPVSALQEKGLIKWVGANTASLEDELCAFTANGYVGGGSPNRADAFVWAITDLMLGKGSIYGMLQVV